MTRQTSSTRSLREHPDLDQLKRQAKELLAAARAGDPAAVAEVNAHYRGADFPSLALHHAQLVLARAYGFDSWPKLKAYVDGVTVKRLADVVRAGDTARALAMLTARPELINMDMAASDEHNVLHYAVLDRAPAMVRLLMAHGANARKGIYPHREATTALEIATDRGYDEIVAIIEEEEQRRREAKGGPQAATSAAPDELCEAIADGETTRAIGMIEADPTLIQSCHRDGWTPLHAAAALLDERMTGWLVAHGADVNHRGPGDRTPLDMAASPHWRAPGDATRFAAVARLLREGGATMTARAAVALGDADWLRARHAGHALGEAATVDVFAPSSGLLTIAVKRDRPDILTLLLDLGLDPDERGRVEGVEEPEYSAGGPLWHCVEAGKVAMANLLLARGADPNAEVYASGSAMYRAYHQNDDAMIALLARHGGKPDPITASLCGRTELVREMLTGQREAALQGGIYTVAEQIVWGGADAGHPEIVRMALEHIELPPGDSRWHRLLWRPMPGDPQRPDYERFLTCLRLMLERSGGHAPGWFGVTLLHDLAARGASESDEVVAFATTILDAGVRLDVRDDLLRSTALGWAARWGRMALARLLLERGADPIEPDAEPWASPRAWAEQKKQTAILALLRDAGA